MILNNLIAVRPVGWQNTANGLIIDNSFSQEESTSLLCRVEEIGVLNENRASLFATSMYCKNPELLVGDDIYVEWHEVSYAISHPERSYGELYLIDYDNIIAIKRDDMIAMNGNAIVYNIDKEEVYDDGYSALRNSYRFATIYAVNNVEWHTEKNKVISMQFNDGDRVMFNATRSLPFEHEIYNTTGKDFRIVKTFNILIKF